jgi:hypothetical protein
LKEIIYEKLGLNDEIENKKNFYKKNQEQKSKIKRIRTKVGISTTKWTNM